MKPARVKVRLLEGGTMPRRQTPGSAGFDLAASTDATIEPGGYGLVPTGIALEMPAGFEAQVRPRSGLAARHGIGILNSPGTVDSDYRGEVKVILFNVSREPFRVRRGDRIAQLVFSEVRDVELEQTSDLSPSPRGDGGFGHTG